MKTKTGSLLTILILTWLTVRVPEVQAVTTPSFPVCANPQGSVRVSYSEGTHGIVGNTGTYTGSDTVYTLSESTTMQCFCADNGDGTQTNWWHATSLSDEEVQILKNQGWIVVPNGELWGLAAGEWLAYNSPYACPRSNNDDNDNDNNSNGQVLAASIDPGGSVLGLATTGNLTTIYALIGFGFLSLLVGFLLRRFLSL